MPFAERKPRPCKRFLQAFLLLGLPSQALAQEHIFIECRPTVFWARDEARQGSFGLSFIVRSGNDGVYRWRAEERRWSGLWKCPGDPDFVNNPSAPWTCTHNLNAGQARHVGENPRGGGFTSLRSAFSVSRVTGAYRYETTFGADNERLWHEEGICSATENPETAQTQRVF